MTNLIYSGLLDRDTLYSVQHCKHRYAIELYCFPPYEAFRKLFDDRTYEVNGEDCMGRNTFERRQGVAYTWVAKNFSYETDNSGFLLLPTDEDRLRVISTFPELVINENPFQTTVSDSHLDPDPHHPKPCGEHDRMPLFFEPDVLRLRPTAQSRIDSAMEAVTNTTIGFLVALVTWKIISWAMGIPVSTSESFAIVSIFTVVSIIRSYLLRRLFNGRSPWAAIKGIFA